ncbi:hypothetical protein [Myxosarcina sp. GI1(2024)]
MPLRLPDFVPPLNGYENFKWINFESVEELQKDITKHLNKLTTRTIAKITGWKFIIDALCVANI